MNMSHNKGKKLCRWCRKTYKTKRRRLWNALGSWYEWLCNRCNEACAAGW